MGAVSSRFRKHVHLERPTSSRPSEEGVITVVCRDGKTMTFSVFHGDKICDVKLKIENQFSVPRSQQLLCFVQRKCDIHVLQDDNDAFFGREGLTLLLIQKGLDDILFIKHKRAGVQYFEQETLVIDYDSGDTIVNVKEKLKDNGIEEIEGQMLNYQGCILEDEKSLTDYNIQKQSTLQLFTGWGIKINQIDGDTSKQFRNVKEIKQQNVNIPGKKQELPSLKLQPEMQLFIVSSRLRTTLALKACHLDTIAELKTKIEERLELYNDQYQLTFKGQYLEERKRLCECHLQQESTLYVNERMHDQFQLVIVSDKCYMPFTLEVEPTDTIANLKSRLQDKYKILSARCIHLQLTKRFDDQVLEDEYTLKDYGIGKSTRLSLRDSYALYYYITPDGTQIPVTRREWNFHGDAFDSITAVPPCTPFQMPLFIQIQCHTNTSRNIAIAASPSSRVQDVIVNVHNILVSIKGLKPTKERDISGPYQLTFAGKKLGEEQTISDCGIQRECVVHLKLDHESEPVTIPNSAKDVVSPLYPCDFPVFIQKSGRSQIIIRVKPHTTVGGVKRVIESREHFPASQQSLIYAGRMLDDSKSVSDCKIRSGSVLHLMIQKSSIATIFVKTPSGKTIALKINPSASTRQLKLKANVHEIEGISLDQQVLTFAGRMLEDNKTLISYGITHQCTLYITANDTYMYPIYVRTLQDQNISLYVSPNDTISRVKSLIHKREGILPEQQQLLFGDLKLHDSCTVKSYGIHSLDVLMLIQPTDNPAVIVKVYTGDVYALEHCPNKPITSIKTQLYEKMKIPQEKQLLYLRGQLLEDSQPLSTYTAQSYTTIYLLPKLSEIRIYIKAPDGITISLKTAFLHTTKYIKSLIWHQKGILPEEQCLYCDGSYQLLNDSDCLCTYNIQHRSTLQLLVKPCTLSMETATREVIILNWPTQPHDTVGSVKLKLCEGRGITDEKQRNALHLFLDCQELQDYQTLTDYGILAKLFRHTSLLQVFMKSALFITCNSSSRVIALDYDPGSTIADVIQQSKESMALVEEQVLVFSKQLLQDSQTLISYNIQEEDKLTLLPKIIAISVMTQTGMQTVLDVNVLESVKDIKSKIEQEWGLPIDQQILKFNNTELNDCKTICDYSIQDKSTIILSLHPWKNQITIVLPSQIKVLEVDPNDTIGKIKLKIQSKVHILAAQQCLYLQDFKVLDDQKSLDDYGIQNHDTLYLLPIPSSLTVTLHNGTNIECGWPDGSLTQFLADIKLKVPKRITEDSLQHLKATDTTSVFSSNLYLGERLLKGAHDLVDYDVLSQLQDKLTRLHVVDKPVLFIQCHESEEVIAIEYDGSETVLDIKKKSCETFGIQLQESQYCLVSRQESERIKFGVIKPFVYYQQLMEGCTLIDCNIIEGVTIYLVQCEVSIFIQIEDCAFIPLVVKPMKHTVKDVEEMIWNELKEAESIHEHMPLYDFDGEKHPHIFLHNYSGNPLFTKDPNPLFEEHIKSGSILKLSLVHLSFTLHHHTPIYVETSAGKTICLTVEGHETVHQVKSIIKENDPEIPFHQMQLIFNGKVLKDEVPLSYYGVGWAGTIDLLVKDRSLLIKMHLGKTIAIEYDPTDTVANVKEKIAKKEKISPIRQRLILGGTGLELKDSDLLKSCNVTAKSTLSLVLKRKMQIQVTTLVGETQLIILDVQSEDTVESIKLLIQLYTEAPPNQQVLYLAGCELNDWMTLSDYRIQHHSNLHLVLLQLHVRTPSGEEVVVRYSESETVVAIKAQLCAATRILPQEQRLLFCDQELEDQLTLGHYHINNGQTLYMEHIQGFVDDIAETEQILTPVLSDRPELYQLQHLQGQGGVVFKVIEKVASHWERLALALHFEGHVLEIVRRDHISDCMAQCRTILYRWLNGEARSPVNWETLVTSLKEIEFTLLAEGLEAVLRK